MLIVPLSARMSLKNPPVATLALIAINCLVFLSFYSSDRRIDNEAYDYYLRSGLAVMEVRAYDQYKAYGKVIRISPADVSGRPVPLAELFSRMEQMQKDKRFMKALDEGRVITPEIEIYPLWKEKRGFLEGLLSGTTAMRWGFRPAFWDFQGMVTYMFFHSGFMHLIGNMLFLWLAGCVVELAWGRIACLFIYCMGGLFSAALFGLAYLGSTEPLVGASGAIAALMGAYAVLYGRKKIKVFYSLGFYFDYTLVPGFAILCLWVGNEFFQLLFGSETGVAYMAHIGGFSSGALLGLLSRRYNGGEAGRASQGTGEKVTLLLDEALQKVENLEVDRARTLFRQVLDIDPNNRTALTQMFHLEKMQGDSVAFHDITRKLLAVLTRDKQAHREVQAVYQEYIQRAGTPKLHRDMIFTMTSYFASTGHLDEAEEIVGMLMKKSPDLPKLPECLLYLARACLKGALTEKARSYFQVICLRYPDSRENAIARRALDDLET